MQLYSYWRSSAAYRVRIALNLKGLDCEIIEVSLIDGEHRRDAYLSVNPQGLVPFLIDGDQAMGQSMAIIEYLEESYADVPLLPESPAERALARQIANIIACDIHPLCNLRVLNYLQGPLGADDAAKAAWYRHWVSLGFDAIEALLAESAAGDYCVGDRPSVADVLLIPQVYNAKRFNVPLDNYPLIGRIEAHCTTMPPFAKAAPEAQNRG